MLADLGWRTSWLPERSEEILHRGPAFESQTLPLLQSAMRGTEPGLSGRQVRPGCSARSISL